MRQRKKGIIEANPVLVEQTLAEPLQKKNTGQKHPVNSDLATKKRKQWIP